MSSSRAKQLMAIFTVITLHSVGRRDEYGDIRKVCDCAAVSLQIICILGYFNTVNVPAVSVVWINVKAECRTQTVRDEMLQLRDTRHFYATVVDYTLRRVSPISTYCKFRHFAVIIPIWHILKLITFRTSYSEQNLCSALRLMPHRDQIVEPENNCQWSA